ncbi:MAG: hypothetical protein RR248_06015 [Clostridia bacterium]
MKSCNEVLPKLKILLGNEATKYTDEYLLLQLEMAVEAVNNRRSFVASKPTVIVPTPDIMEEKFKMLLVQITATAINKVGAEGEVSHSENGIARAYGSDSIYPIGLMNSIIPLVGTVAKNANA